MTATSAVEIAGEAHVAGSQERFYRPELDALRAGAFLLVFLHHVLPQQMSGWATLGVHGPVGALASLFAMSGGFGVDLFFALSSYLITELLLREVRAHGRLDVRAFYIRRILRIWPLFYAFLLAAIFVIPRILYGTELPSCYRWPYLLLMGNWANALCGHPASPVAPLWSISIEEQFYLVWPIVLSRVRADRLKHACVYLLVLATVSRLLYILWGADDTAVWASTFTRLDPIAAGALLALGMRGRGVAWPLAARALVVALGIVGYMVARELGLSGTASLFTYPLAALASVAILAATLGLPMSFAGAGMLIWLGRISYGLYVFHAFAIALAHALPTVRSIEGATPRFVAVLLVALTLTLVMATVSYYVLERPALRLKARYSRVRSRDG